MRKHYDFSNAIPNPYAKLLKRQVTARIDEPALGYFKTLSQEMAIPYQTLIILLPAKVCGLPKAPAYSLGNP